MDAILFIYNDVLVVHVMGAWAGGMMITIDCCSQMHSIVIFLSDYRVLVKKTTRNPNRGTRRFIHTVFVVELSKIFSQSHVVLYK